MHAVPEFVELHRRDDHSSRARDARPFIAGAIALMSPGCARTFIPFPGPCPKSLSLPPAQLRP
jgi:hypothetical protein